MLIQHKHCGKNTPRKEDKSTFNFTRQSSMIPVSLAGISAACQQQGLVLLCQGSLSAQTQRLRWCLEGSSRGRGGCSCGCCSGDSLPHAARADRAAAPQNISAGPGRCDTNGVPALQRGSPAQPRTRTRFLGSVASDG